MDDTQADPGPGPFVTLLTEESEEVRPGPPPPTGLNERNGRYVVTRPLARGGLGEVFLALDTEFGREVALKRIQERHADDPSSRGRFVREAGVTALLEHPGVVPVYGFGRTADGRPYYAMRLIRGETLETAIAHYHAGRREKPEPCTRPMALLSLLERFVAACEAVAYAHERGVLHRDLKPANVMLGNHGETLVVDWGLAKPVDLPEIAGAGALRLEDTPAGASTEETLPGSPIGTPSFMSPEQAAGDLESVGTASDVYNLGATLYCILTGRAPFERMPLGELLPRIMAGDVRPPRTVTPVRLSKPLEAICLKAMARQPADRYPTARALADDIRRWVADEPVVACPERPGEKLRRWSRRHRGLVRTGAVALFSLPVVLGVVAGLVDMARQRQQELRHNAERLAAGLMLDRGLNLCELGHPSSGRLRLVQALAMTPAECDDMRRAVLANLAAWGAPAGKLRRIYPQPGGARAVAFAPGGATLVTAGTAGLDSGRGEARAWETQTGRPAGPPLDHPAAVTCLGFDGSADPLWTGCADGVVRTWNLRTGRETAPPMNHGAPVVAVLPTPGGRLLTAGGNAVRLWDRRTGKVVRTFPEHPEVILGAALSPGGRLLATGCRDGHVRLWDVSTGTQDGTPLAHGAPVTCVAFRPDGAVVLAGGEAGHVRFWDTATRHRLLARPGHRAEVTCAVYSPDGSTVLTGSGDNTAVLWDAATGLPHGLPLEHRSTVWSIAFRPDGRGLVTGSDVAARLWDLPGAGGPVPVARDESALAGLAVNGTTGDVVEVSAEGQFLVRDPKSLAPIGPARSVGMAVRSATFDDQGKLCVVGGEDGRTLLWDVAAGRPIRELIGHRGPVVASAVFAGGTRVITGARDATVRVWDATTGQSIGHVWSQGAAVAALAVSNDGKTALVACGDTARLWDVATGRPFGIAMVHQGLIECAAFHPGERSVVTGGEDNAVRVWDSSTGRPLRPPLEHQASVRALAFSPDGRTLLTGCNDRGARLWTLDVGRPLGPPHPHLGWVTRVAWAPDGRAVVTASADGTTRAWHRPLAPHDDEERLRLETEVSTGLTVDTTLDAEGQIEMLGAPRWESKRGRLQGRPASEAP